MAASSQNQGLFHSVLLTLITAGLALIGYLLVLNYNIITNTIEKHDSEITVIKNFLLSEFEFNVDQGVDGMYFKKLLDEQKKKHNTRGGHQQPATTSPQPLINNYEILFTPDTNIMAQSPY